MLPDGTYHHEDKNHDLRVRTGAFAPAEKETKEPVQLYN